MRVIHFVLCASAVLAADVEQGRAVFRSNCAFCHGMTGLGGRGPELVRALKPDDEIKRVIRQGIPGTTMPSFGGFESPDLDNLIAFMRHLAGSVPPGERVNGDPVRGQTVYAKFACASCHQIGNTGSTYGPELTRVGAARPAHYLRESMTEPSHDIPPQYEGVTVVAKDGVRTRGIRVNEDTFSVQLRLPNEKFASFRKDAAQEIVYEKASPMPSYASMPKADLDDLIAYLTTLRGQANRGAAVKQAEGIR